MEIEVVAGDIVDQRVDAVVNAANSGLMGGGGVDGAILRAGGTVQLHARRELVERIGSLPTGQAAATDAGTMPARWIIHVVGPVHSRSEDRRALLASCYREALRVADELGARTIAFPAVSAGIYGWPIDSAADIAVQTVASTPTDVERRPLRAVQRGGAGAVPAGARRALAVTEAPKRDRAACRRRSAAPPSAGRTSTRCWRRWRRAVITSARTCRGPTRAAPSSPRSSPRPSPNGTPARPQLRHRGRRQRRAAGRMRAARAHRRRRPRDRLLAAGRRHGSRPRDRSRPGASPTWRSTVDGVSRVEIHCDEANVRSAAVARRLGYRLDRIEPDVVSAPGDLGRSMIWVSPPPTDRQAPPVRRRAGGGGGTAPGRAGGTGRPTGCRTWPCWPRSAMTVRSSGEASIDDAHAAARATDERRQDQAEQRVGPERRQLAGEVAPAATLPGPAPVEGERRPDPGDRRDHVGDGR